MQPPVVEVRQPDIRRHNHHPPKHPPRAGKHPRRHLLQVREEYHRIERVVRHPRQPLKEPLQKSPSRTKRRRDPRYEPRVLRKRRGQLGRDQRLRHRPAEGKHDEPHDGQQRPRGGYRVLHSKRPPRHVVEDERDQRHQCQRPPARAHGHKRRPRKRMHPRPRGEPVPARPEQDRQAGGVAGLSLFFSLHGWILCSGSGVGAVPTACARPRALVHVVSTSHWHG
mmetsp:Transcript_4891/g.14179  ORF Transcript_4891/g.14179 Transcript_4891/m.14179 type:complete len:224 (-) Transcript_4891:48-719(-)